MLKTQTSLLLIYLLAIAFTGSFFIFFIMNTKSLSKKLVLASFFFLGSVVTSSAASPRSNIAFYDLDAVYKSHPDYTRAMDSIKTFEEKINEDLQKKRQESMAKVEKIMSDAKKSGKDMTKAQEEEATAIINQLQKDVASAEEKTKAKRKEAITPIQSSVDSAVKTICDTKGFSAAFVKLPGIISYVYEGNDITNDLSKAVKGAQKPKL